MPEGEKARAWLPQARLSHARSRSPPPFKAGSKRRTRPNLRPCTSAPTSRSCYVFFLWLCVNRTQVGLLDATPFSTRALLAQRTANAPALSLPLEQSVEMLGNTRNCFEDFVLRTTLEARAAEAR